VATAAGPQDNRCIAEESKTHDPSESRHEAEREQALILPLRKEIEEAQALGWSRPRDLRERLARFEKSAAGRYWAHLSTADFMNSSFAFAALAVLSAFPFLAVSSSVIGGDIRQAIVARMGLNARAAHDIDGLIATGNQAVATLTWLSAIVLVLGGIGMASTLSAWYHRIYERTPSKGFLRHLAYQAGGVVAFTLYISFQVELFDKAREVGGRGLVFLLTFVTAALFWWWSSYMLLYRQVPMRQMFPAGVATAACITGLAIVSAFFFSDQVTSGQKSYGPAGVVIALITFLVGFGVCLHAGAVFGRMWNERQAERASLDNQSGPIAETNTSTRA
jgi:membrane protein